MALLEVWFGISNSKGDETNDYSHAYLVKVEILFPEKKLMIDGKHGCMTLNRFYIKCMYSIMVSTCETVNKCIHIHSKQFKAAPNYTKTGDDVRELILLLMVCEISDNVLLTKKHISII